MVRLVSFTCLRVADGVKHVWLLVRLRGRQQLEPLMSTRGEADKKGVWQEVLPLLFFYAELVIFQMLIFNTSKGFYRLVKVRQ